MGDSDFLSREKRRKWEILTFSLGRNAVFTVFRSSSVDESRFFPFSDDSVHGICSFQRFLMIPSTEYVVFSVF